MIAGELKVGEGLVAAMTFQHAAIPLYGVWWCQVIYSIIHRPTVPTFMESGGVRLFIMHWPTVPTFIWNLVLSGYL